MRGRGVKPAEEAMSDDLQVAGPAMSARAVPLKLVVQAEAEARLADEQLAYARVLDAGMKVGFLSLVVTFVLYVLGVIAPHIPVEELPRYWSLPVKQYLAVTGVHAGWGWLDMLGKGDFLNFVGIAFLSGVAMLCYASIAPIFFQKKDRIYAWLTVIEIGVLALAASGVLKAGGH